VPGQSLRPSAPYQLAEFDRGVALRSQKIGAGHVGFEGSSALYFAWWGGVWVAQGTGALHGSGMTGTASTRPWVPS